MARVGRVSPGLGSLAEAKRRFAACWEGTGLRTRHYMGQVDRRAKAGDVGMSGE